MFVQAADNLDHDVSHWIAAIIAPTSPFLQARRRRRRRRRLPAPEDRTIDTNTLQVTKPV